MLQSTLVVLTGLASTGAPRLGTPFYDIVDLGVAADAHVASQAFGISPGGVVAGRSLGPAPDGSEVAFLWTSALGLVALPAPRDPTLPFCMAVAANDSGAVVGVAAVDQTGAKPRPVLWVDGVAHPLPLPRGESVGRALAINASGVIVGSVGAKIELGAIFHPDEAQVISIMLDGTFLQTAKAIDGTGRITGIGSDPNLPAVDVGLVIEPGGAAFIVGELPGSNGAQCLGLSNAGHIVGESNFDGGNGLPYVWSSRFGMMPIPLPPYTFLGAAAAVNSRGWAVGTAAGDASIPFLFNGVDTYRLQDLLPPNSGWALLGNTFASATGISEGCVIVGTGSLDGQARAFVMIPQWPTCLGDLDRNGVVDGQDLAILLAAWGPVLPGVSQDLDADGQVGGLDVGLLLGAWGPCR